jgi:hypothetical protein
LRVGVHVVSVVIRTGSIFRIGVAREGVVGFSFRSTMSIRSGIATRGSRRLPRGSRHHLVLRFERQQVAVRTPELERRNKRSAK